MASSSSSLRRSWVIQCRVVGALLMREVLTRYGRHNIGFLWLFAEPMIFTLGVTALWTALRAVHGSHLPIVAFAVTGYSSVLLWRNMPHRCIGAVEPNLSLMYHRNVKVLDVFLARLVLEAVGATISFVILTLVCVSIGVMPMPENLLQVVVAWILLAWFGSGLAVFMGSLSERTELVEKLWSPITYLMFPLSGAAFIVDIFSPPMQHFLLYLPMVNGVEMLREGYFGSAATFHYSAGYLLAWCMGLSLIGLAQTRQVSRLVQPE
jgi:capsular polysaccharide transport system permease protein